LDLARRGVPFRDAYRQVAASLDSMEVEDPVKNIRAKKHQGATGNLRLDLARNRLQELADELARLHERWNGALERLLEEARR